MSFPNVSDIVATTIESRTRQIADNVTKNNAVLQKLSQSGRIKTASGGTKILPELSFAENLLRYRDDNYAIIFKGEAMEQPARYSYRELYREVACLAKSLRDEGVKTGDRVVGFMPNMPETIVAMLAAALV